MSKQKLSASIGFAVWWMLFIGSWIALAVSENPWVFIPIVGLLAFALHRWIL